MFEKFKVNEKGPRETGASVLDAFNDE